MENVDFLRKQVELAQSSQSSIEGLYSLAAEVSRFYFAITSIFPHFFNTLFSAYVQGLTFSRAVSRINLSRFNPVLPRNFLLQRETRPEEENVQAKNATPYIPFMLNSTLTQILTSDISEPSSPEIEIGRETTETLEKAPEKYPVYSIIQRQTELLSKVVPSLENIRFAYLEYERKLFMSKPVLSEKSILQPATVLKEEEVGKLMEEKPEITPATHFALWQPPLANMAFSSLHDMFTTYTRYQRLGVSSALPAVTTALALFSLVSSNIATSTISSAPFETPTEEKATQESPFTETSAFWDKTREIQAAAEFAVRAQEIVSAMQSAIGLAVITHSINLVSKPETIEVAGASVRPTSPKEPATSSLKSLAARPKIDEKPFSLPKELTAEEESPQGLSARVGLSSETLELLSKSAELPNLIFENQLPFLKIADTLSRISVGPETVSMPIHEVTYDQPATISSPVPMPQPQISLLLHEIAPSLTSWIYEGSEALRDTGVPLSAVPIAASEAERVVSETLAEPTPRRVAAQPPIEGKPSAVPKRASRLPTLIALAGAGSLISQRLGNELVALKKEAKIEEAVAMTRPVQNIRELPAVEGSAEAWFASPSGRFVMASVGAVLSGKPVIALSTILVHSQSLWEKIRETQDVTSGAVLGLEAARRTYELPILEHGYAAAQYPKRGKTDFWSRAREAQAMAEFAANTQVAFAAMQAELALSAIGSQMGKQISQMMATEEAETKGRESSTKRARLSKPYPIEPSIRRAPPVSPPAARTSPEIPAFDETEPDEAAEEDLRDLERKISRILSEQLSRYYGTSRM